MSTLNSRFVSALADTSPRQIGQYLSGLVYRVSRTHALNQVRAEVGARAATIEAIAERKAYDEIGPTEITAALGSQWAEQPAQNLQLLASLYETHPWVKICVSYIASSLAGMPLRVYKATGFEDGKEILEPYDDSPVGRMFRWVNPQQSPAEFNEDLASWLLLCGEAYVAFSRPGPQTPRGIPAEMYVLFSPFVEKVVSPTLGVIGYNYRVSGQSAFFEAHEVAYFRTFSPAGRFRGQGTASAGWKTIAADFALREFNSNVLNQGVHLSGVLETDNEDLDKDKAKVVRETFMSDYGGSKNASKIAVLWGGLKFSPQTILQKDVMMSEQLTSARDEIIALFGLKPELLTEKFSNKATAQTVRKMAYEDVILGRWGRRIESTYNSTGLMRFDPDLRVRFDQSDVPALQESAKEKIDAGAAAISSGQMTINESRDKFLGLPPIDGIEGDVILVNGTPLANSLSPADTESPPKGTSLEHLLIEGKNQYSTVSACLIKQTESDIAFDRLRSISATRMERALRSVYRELQKDIRVVTTRSSVDARLITDIEQIFFFDGRKAVVDAMSATARTAIDEAVALELANLRIEGLFDVKPVRALRRLSTQEQRIRNMGGKQWIDLQRELNDGLAMGESSAKLNSRVSQFFDGARTNAATIARTEINAAVNGATMDVAIAARDQGVDVVSVWVTSQDELVRKPPKGTKNHAQAHGLTIIPGEELFKVSGQNLEYPGDSWNGATADNTINCRCGVRNEVRKISAADNRGEA